jgi:hypothetical protein
MLEASEPLSPESAATQETSFRELAHLAIGIVRRQLLLIALIGAGGNIVWRVLCPHSAFHLYSRIQDSD